MPEYNSADAYLPAELRLIADFIENGWFHEEPEIEDPQVCLNAVRTLERGIRHLLNGRTIEDLERETFCDY